VCLFVRSHISKTAQPHLTKFFNVLTAIVAQYSILDDSALRYILPVLWMPSCFCGTVYVLVTQQRLQLRELKSLFSRDSRELIVRRITHSLTSRGLRSSSARRLFVSGAICRRVDNVATAAAAARRRCVRSFVRPLSCRRSVGRSVVVVLQTTPSSCRPSPRHHRPPSDRVSAACRPSAPIYLCFQPRLAQLCRAFRS